MTDVLNHAKSNRVTFGTPATAGIRACIRNVRAVTPAGIVDDATVTIQGGVIIEVAERGTPSPGAIDGRGALLLPGLVDTHSDGLEKETSPRPSVQLPIDFALRSFEGRVRAAGITTIFHGVGFEDDSRHSRTVELANTTCDAIEAHQSSGEAIIDHRILYRLDARDIRGFKALVKRLDQRMAGSRDGSVNDEPAPLVSFEDHTPGQGQYTDRTGFETYIAGTRKIPIAQARQVVDELIVERESLKANRDRALPWLTRAAASGEIQLMAHDPTSAFDIDEAEEWQASIAEFPTTTVAANAAKDRGMTVVCGAPNVLRGGSHSGNVSAQDLIAAGLCDVLASDYMPSTLLGAVAGLVHRGVCDLRRAVELVTSGPAAAMGLRDRGRIAPGFRADLALVSITGRLPTVRGVWSAEEVR